MKFRFWPTRHQPLFVLRWQSLDKSLKFAYLNMKSVVSHALHELVPFLLTVFVKTMVCCGCSFLQVQKNWFCLLIFKGFPVRVPFTPIFAVLNVQKVRLSLFNFGLRTASLIRRKVTLHSRVIASYERNYGFRY